MKLTTSSTTAAAAMLFIILTTLNVIVVANPNLSSSSSPSSSSSSSVSSLEEKTTTTTTTTISASASAQSSSSSSASHSHHQSKTKTKTKTKNAKNALPSPSPSPLLFPRVNPFSNKQSPPTMPIAPTIIHKLITCYSTRPGYTLWTNPAFIRRVYKKMWKHGGEFEAPPGEIRRVMCRKTGGVFVLNTTDKVMYIPYADIGGMTRDAMEACDNHFGQANGEMKDQDGKGYIVIISHTDQC